MAIQTKLVLYVMRWRLRKRSVINFKLLYASLWVIYFIYFKTSRQKKNTSSYVFKKILIKEMRNV